MSSEMVAVTPEDREAAAAQIAWLIEAEQRLDRVPPFFHVGLPDGIRRGVWDNHDAVQAFARHRLAERERIVAGMPMSSEMVAEAEFCARFKARMLKRAGPTFDDGDSIADYADETAPTYFENDHQRAEGPEACADADMSYWGE